MKQKKSQDEDELPSSPSKETSDERTRHLQEEIQRKIAQRRQSHQRRGSPTHSAPPPPLRQKPSPYRTTPIGRELKQEVFPEPSHTSTEPTFFEIPKPTRNLQAELEAQKKQLDESLRRAETAKLEAHAQIARLRTPVERSSSQSKAQSLRTVVSATLADPRAVQKAVLYYEILGAPVGMRSDGASKPAWAI